MLPKAIKGKIELFFVLRCGCFPCLQRREKLNGSLENTNFSLKDKTSVGVEIVLLKDRNNQSIYENVNEN